MVGETHIRNAKILIVDDMEANVRLLEGMLRGAGYTSVDATVDPADVCRLHLLNSYDLILLDLQMPHLDGFQVMECLKEIEKSGYLPVLAITAQPDHKLRALGAGAKDFVTKPFDLAELRARVYNMLEVRLLHTETRLYSRMLEETARELEVSREVIRLKTLEEARRTQQELALAQETQESLLPRTLPRLDEFHVHAFNNPTRYVGGDFYDFLHLASGEWAGILSDVSGKGISAALLSSMVLGALGMEFRSGTQEHEVLNRVNRLLCERSLPSQFVTVFLFVLNRAGIGRFISAGHNPTFLFRSATGKVETLRSDSGVVGLFESECYQSRPLHLFKGDILVVYSDGLTDAQNALEDVFGEERLVGLIREQAPRGSHTLERTLLSEMHQFTQGAPQTDDITFVIVEKC